MSVGAVRGLCYHVISSVSYLLDYRNVSSISMPLVSLTRSAQPWEIEWFRADMLYSVVAGWHSYGRQITARHMSETSKLPQNTFGCPVGAIRGSLYHITHLMPVRLQESTYIHAPLLSKQRSLMRIMRDCLILSDLSIRSTTSLI